MIKVNFRKAAVTGRGLHILADLGSLQLNIRFGKSVCIYLYMLNCVVYERLTLLWITKHHNLQGQ